MSTPIYFTADADELVTKLAHAKCNLVRHIIERFDGGERSDELTQLMWRVDSREMDLDAFADAWSRSLGLRPRKDD